jgi:hypothetical protein
LTFLKMNFTLWGIIGLSSKIFEYIMSKGVASLECCWWGASRWRKNVLDIVVDVVNYE